jgi:hypothetical protein
MYYLYVAAKFTGTRTIFPRDRWGTNTPAVSKQGLKLPRYR